MKTLNFNFNWNNKLSCDYFTTIRISDYFNVGDEVLIQLNKQSIDSGIISEKICTRIEKLTELVSRIDTGYNREQTIGIIKKMYPGITDWENQKIYIYGINTKYPSKSEREAEAYAVERIKILKQKESVINLIKNREILCKSKLSETGL